MFGRIGSALPIIMCAGLLSAQELNSNSFERSRPQGDRRYACLL